MNQNINIEAEGSELILKNSHGDVVIIPKKYRTEVQDMIREGCHDCIDRLVETLPVMEDYAEDGSVYPLDTKGVPIRKETYTQWGERIKKIAPNLDYTKNDGTYNYRGAYEGGLEPEFNTEDKQYHLGSRNPITGEVLKSEKHLSFNEFLKEENKLGYNVYKAKDGKVYSHPKNQIKEDNVLEYVTYGGTLEPAVATAGAPEWAKYTREYVKNNPFNIDEYVENRINNPVGREAIKQIDSKGWRKKLRQEGLEKRHNAILDYVSEQLVKSKPQGKLSRAEWLNSMTDKEEEIIKRNPKYQSSLWADTKRGLTSLVEQNPLQAFQNILNSSDYSDREKQEMLKDYIDHPIMSKLGDAVKILNPLTIPSKMVQSAYKADYSFTDALKGKKNEAGIIEDIITDPLNLIGVGIAGKLSKADKVIDATKAGSKVVNKTDDIVKLVERKAVFDKETLDLIDRFNRYYNGDKTVKLSLSEKTKIGRDVAFQKDLNKAYRNTHIDEIINARKQGYFNNNRFPDTDWYYGGSASKYGNIEVEAVPDAKYFRLFEVDGKYTGIITPDKDILHLKGSNVPFKGTIVRYKGKILTDNMLEEISKRYKKEDNLDEIIQSITKSK